MSQALRKLTATIKRSNTMVIFINQIRMKIGVMFGNPETTTGGNALKFYASVRLDIRRIGAIKDRDEVIGNQTRSRWSRTRWRRRSSRPSSTSCTARASPAKGEIIDLGVKAKRRREVRRLVLLQRRAHRPGLIDGERLWASV
jgi:recombination protein RecA